METRQPAVGPLLVALQAALGERQALLAGSLPPAARDRNDALGLLIVGLLEQLTAVQPPAVPLYDQATAAGESDRFTDRGDPQRRAA